MDEPIFPIFVVSDLHMGDGGPRDNFQVGGRDQQFLQFLEHVSFEGGRLIILGDLFEFWQANLSTVLVKRRAILDRLAELKATYVLGNHDVDLINFIGSDFLRHPFFERMTRPVEEGIAGKKHRFMHGHEPDPFNKSDSPSTGRMLAILAGIAEDWNGSPNIRENKSMEEFLEKSGEAVMAAAKVSLFGLKMVLGLGDPPPLEKGLTPTQARTRLDDHIADIKKDRERGGYQVAVVGHTHQLGRVGDWYYNSGSWTGATNDFLRIEADGRIDSYRWEGGTANGITMPLAFEGRYERSSVG